MTTDATADPPERSGTFRLERNLGVVAAAFGLLYSLQTADAAVAGWSSITGPLGVVLLASVAASLVLGLLAAAVPRRARRLFGAAVVAYALALLLWPLALHGAVPSSPMPWFAGLWPAQALFLAMAARRPAVPVLASFGVAGYVIAVLVLRGSQPLQDALASGLFAVVVAGLLAALVTIVRRGAQRAEAAQRTALASYGRARLDDATEVERARTDALVHDSVLTTLLAAASARSEEDERLADRMASNALRVLGHVTRSAERGPVVAFGRAAVIAEQDIAPLLPGFAVDVTGAEDIVLPVQVAEALIGALAEAMRNSMQHAGAGAARTLSVAALGPDGIRIVVRDDGAGFDRAAVMTGATALRAAVIDRLRRVDGRADVESTIGGGTTVTLSWGSVVVSGTEPLEREVVA